MPEEEKLGRRKRYLRKTDVGINSEGVRFDSKKTDRKERGGEGGPFEGGGEENNLEISPTNVVIDLV